MYGLYLTSINYFIDRENQLYKSLFVWQEYIGLGTEARYYPWKIFEHRHKIDKNTLELSTLLKKKK